MECQPSPDCPLYETERGCYEDVHHTYYPRRRYKTSVERQFRELPENKELMCRAEHNEIHATQQPPKKPSRAVMLQAIAAHITQEVA